MNVASKSDVAELESAFLCADLHTMPEVRLDHASYIESWLKALKAASHARIPHKASRYWNGRKSPTNVQVRQRALQLGYSRIGDFGFPDFQEFERLHGLQVLQPGVGDIGSSEPNRPQMGQTREVREAHVIDAASAKVQRRNRPVLLELAEAGASQRRVLQG